MESAAFSPGHDLPTRILIVDDEVQIRELLSRWLTSRGFRCLLAENAQAALKCLESEPIGLVTADISMPEVSGIDLLQRIRSRYPEIAVLMLTAVQTTASAIEALSGGAFGYLIKPVQREEFLAQIDHGLEWHRLHVERRRYTESLEQRVREQTQTIRLAHEETIHRLVAAAACRDLETGAHIVRTGLYSEVLALAAGWSSADAEQIRLAAPMHDIGKIGVPDAILRKAGSLTPAERRTMQRHTVIGAKLLSGSSSAVLSMGREIALCHHERWDGGGYPHGIAGERISEAARIVSIADVYDALTHDRVYRPALPEAVAVEMMAAESGRQFDPRLMAVFFTVQDALREVSKDHPDDPNSSPLDVCDEARSRNEACLMMDS
jgi:putative two-component system response regulator